MHYRTVCLSVLIVVLSEANTVVHTQTLLRAQLDTNSSFVCLDVVCDAAADDDDDHNDVSEPASEYVISIKAFNNLGNGPSRYDTVVTSEDIGTNMLLSFYRFCLHLCHCLSL